MTQKPSFRSTCISSSLPGIQFSSNQIKQGKAVVQGQIFYVTCTGSFLRIICSRKQCLALFLLFISSNRFSRQFFHQIKDCKLQQKIKFREINTSSVGLERRSNTFFLCSSVIRVLGGFYVLPIWPHCLWHFEGSHLQYSIDCPFGRKFAMTKKPWKLRLIDS